MRNLAAIAVLALFMTHGVPAFCDGIPIPVADVRFSPPVSDVSALNSDKKMLAVQMTLDSVSPAKVLSVDKRGRVGTVQDLTEIRAIKVPASKLWMAGEDPGPDKTMPVTSVRVYLSGGGETYTVVYKTNGCYYELRHYDKNGRLLFTASPNDGYGLKTVLVSYDGSRVVVVDESPFTGGETGDIGQHIYFYARDGKLLAEHDFGDDLDTWLDASGGLLAGDGGYFIAARGRGRKTGASLAMFDGDGKLKWDKSFFKQHRLMEDFGGLFGVKGGSQSLLSFIDKDGAQKVLERSGFGFDFWLSPDGKYAYIIVFKPFNVAKCGVPERVKAIFPDAKVVAVDLNDLLPDGGRRPGVVVAPDGKAFLFGSTETLPGQKRSTLIYFDETVKELWRDSFFGGVTPQFVDGSRGFIVKVGDPATRLVYYETR